jgi:hypothetical protein
MSHLGNCVVFYLALLVLSRMDSLGEPPPLAARTLISAEIQQVSKFDKFRLQKRPLKIP